MIANGANNPISASVGVPFTIALPVNATTGYVWVPRFSPADFKFESESFAPSRKEIGAPAQQSLVFRPLRAGLLTIALDLRRSWEDRVLETKRVEVIAEERS